MIYYALFLLYSLVLTIFSSHIVTMKAYLPCQRMNLAINTQKLSDVSLFIWGNLLNLRKTALFIRELQPTWTNMDMAVRK